MESTGVKFSIVAPASFSVLRLRSRCSESSLVTPSLSPLWMALGLRSDYKET